MKAAEITITRPEELPFDCSYLRSLGFEPYTSGGNECCPTCHSNFHPHRGGYIIEWHGFKLHVCCAMERAVTGITFDMQLKRIMP